MNEFARQLFDDVESICLPLNVMVREAGEDVLESTSVIIREAQRHAYEVTLLADQDDIAPILNTELERLFSRCPYRVLDELRGTAIANQFLVGPALG